MSRRRNLQAATEQPPSPDSFAPNQVICLVGQSKGSNVFEVTDVTGQTLLVELPSKFRKSVWIRRGSYVIVARTEELSGTKLQGVIEFVITADLLKEWKRKGLWLVEPQFTKTESTKNPSEA
ncbi:hypothetical protein DACRYDRAFT_12978 [Dacryopinax primogenitus]|uniref:S1-like domain-containing protein n=1 Tax=Dacryopinax primogenitus (strain DJM 731) TaxID=1858805 RepID=M5GCJ8_DACPD|nr:uncharacterized protein DACRYDRAFT_12978 [Dacryopinax primogenitus]EJU06255.1 hypothetical protein DACRYDRAFT_12978 [Dacryopinax primogenitus]